MSDDRFCFYCQREFTTRPRLVAHVLKEHPDTYAYTSMLEEEEKKKG